MSAVSTESLLALLPHRPPMVWVDEVVEATETGGECLSFLKAGRPFLDGQMLKPHACVELIAQAYGYSRACYFRQNSDKKAPARAYLAGIRDFVFRKGVSLLFVPSARGGHEAADGDCLRIQVSVEKILGPLTLVSGRVLSPTGETIAEGSLKLFAE